MLISGLAISYFRDDFHAMVEKADAKKEHDFFATKTCWGHKVALALCAPAPGNQIDR